jgi:thiol:disulfide interchange protein DsbA
MKKIALMLSALILTGALSGNALAAQFQEGVQYQRVVPQQPTSTDDKVEVVEMFWYGCPHCYRLEPYVKRWLKRKPAAAKFVRMPAIFRPEWEIHARAYYTAEILGVVDKVHDEIFEAIHEKRQRLNNEAAIMAFFTQHGVSEKDFKRVFHSFAVETKVRRSKDMSRRYGIKGVPSLIVNGKYRTSGQDAGGNAKIFRVVNYLVEQEAK